MCQYFIGSLRSGVKSHQKTCHNINFAFSHVAVEDPDDAGNELFYSWECSVVGDDTALCINASGEAGGAELDPPDISLLEFSGE